MIADAQANKNREAAAAIEKMSRGAPATATLKTSQQDVILTQTIQSQHDRVRELLAEMEKVISTIQERSRHVRTSHEDMAFIPTFIEPDSGNCQVSNSMIVIANMLDGQLSRLVALSQQFAE